MCCIIFQIVVLLQCKTAHTDKNALLQIGIHVLDHVFTKAYTHVFKHTATHITFLMSCDEGKIHINNNL